MKFSASSIWPRFFQKFDASATIEKYFHTWVCKRNNSPGELMRYLTAVEKRPLEVARQLANDPMADAVKDAGYARLITFLATERKMHVPDQKRAIAAMWQALGSDASTKGTYMHKQCENYWNNEPYDTSGREMEQFASFLADHPHYEGYRTEWSVFVASCSLGGQIDLIVRDKRTGGLVMIDYKRCEKELGPENPWGRTGLAPFEDLPDTTFGHYCVQQNIYAWILREFYDINLEGVYLLQMHPKLDTYHFVPVLDAQRATGIVLRKLMYEVDDSEAERTEQSCA